MGARAGRETWGLLGTEGSGGSGGPVITPVRESRRFERGPPRGAYGQGAPFWFRPSRGLISECSRHLSQSPCPRNSFWGARPQ